MNKTFIRTNYPLTYNRLVKFERKNKSIYKDKSASLSQKLASMLELDNFVSNPVHVLNTFDEIIGYNSVIKIDNRIIVNNIFYRTYNKTLVITMEKLIPFYEDFLKTARFPEVSFIE